MPAQIATLFVFESGSTPGKVYQTMQYVDGSTSCECPGWVFKRKTAGGLRTCKHTRYVETGMGNRHLQSSSRMMTQKEAIRKVEALQEECLTALKFEHCKTNFQPNESGEDQ